MPLSPVYSCRLRGLLSDDGIRWTEPTMHTSNPIADPLPSLTRHEVTASGRGPKEHRAIRRASSENRAVLGLGNVRGGEAVAERREGAGVELTSSPPTGATSRHR